MILTWREFKIDLAEFNNYLKENIPTTDGIVADPMKFEIVESVPFTEEQKTLIENYYNSLVPVEE